VKRISEKLALIYNRLVRDQVSLISNMMNLRKYQQISEIKMKVKPRINPTSGKKLIQTSLQYLIASPASLKNRGLSPRDHHETISKKQVNRKFQQKLKNKSLQNQHLQRYLKKLTQLLKKIRPRK
jgi:hypothetical protein